MDRWAGMISIDPSGAFLGVGNKRMGLAGIASAGHVRQICMHLFTFLGSLGIVLCIIGTFVCMYVCM